MTIVLAIFLSSCSHRKLFPQTGPSLDQTEQLLAVAPSNWQVAYQLNTGATRIVDYLPLNEAEPDWQRKLSFESHQTLTYLDPIEALLAEVAKVRETCDQVQDFNLFSGFENNYKTSTRLLLCGKNVLTNNGEISLLKVIQGNDYLYFIRMLKRTAPFKDREPDMATAEIAEWSRYLSNIKLCDPRQPQHACQIGGQ